ATRSNRGCEKACFFDSAARAFFTFWWPLCNALLFFGFSLASVSDMLITTLIPDPVTRITRKAPTCHGRRFALVTQITRALDGCPSHVNNGRRLRPRDGVPG